MVNWADPNTYPLAVFLCIVGAGGGFCMAYAVAWQMGKTTRNSADRFAISNEQAQYMRNVRERNLQAIEAAAGTRWHGGDRGSRFGAVQGELIPTDPSGQMIC